MARIFLSHSNMNNAEAVALRDWLKREGWEDVFLDVDPDRGIAAGERWERALNEAASRCEAVLFIVSRDWLASGWCLKEFNLAHKLNKRLFGLLIDDIPAADLPVNLTSVWQLVRLHAGTDHTVLRISMPFTGQEAHVTFSVVALGQLKTGLQRAGLDSRFFTWPPESDPNRPPYRGLRPLEADDAGIFFGRDGAIVEAIDRLRGMREAAPPRLLVILGASGAGKSSFLRAGLLPRLARDNQAFLPLPVIRPERAPITGEAGLLRALEIAFDQVRIVVTLADLRAAIQGGATLLRPLLRTLADKGKPVVPEVGAGPKPPVLILSIDQGEELFLAEAQDEAQPFLVLLRDLLIDDAPAIIVVFTIRSDNYERLQTSKELEGIRQQTHSLPPMPKGSYAEVIKGPARRLEGTPRALKIEDKLVDALLADIEAGTATDALPLLAFTLERLYGEFRAGGQLKLSHYDDLGRVKGSIEAAVERAFRAADADPLVANDRDARLALLRRGMIPWLAGIDPDTGAPRRRVARLSEIPAEARPLIQHFVEQRLLVTDVAQDTSEKTIEPAHEALLRQWSLLQGWLADDAGLLNAIDGVKRASRDWLANGKTAAWLTHATGRLEAALRLQERPDLAANLEQEDREYLAECQKLEAGAKGRARRVRFVIYALLVSIITGLVGWINQDSLRDQMSWFMKRRPYRIANMDPYVLKPGAERTLKDLASFRECAKDCPTMVVIPKGEYWMGSPASETGRYDNEGPQHKVIIASRFAVSKFKITFDDWDACVELGGCVRVSDSGWGRGIQPVINITWQEAQQYVAWLSNMTGQPYRLLSEAEWEYAARAGTLTAYSWGEEIGTGNANCAGCGSKWDNTQTSPVDAFAPNAWGLHDMHGNVWEWVQDCYQTSYDGAASDGSAATGGACANRVRRGGSWGTDSRSLRAAFRGFLPTDVRNYNIGFRVGRSLIP